jgi:hypothetical protein
MEDDLFVKLLTFNDKSYKPPSRRVVAGTLLDKEYDNVVNTIKVELRNVNHIALRIDEWSSCQQYSYVGITCHYFSND